MSVTVFDKTPKYLAFSNNLEKEYLPNELILENVYPSVLEAKCKRPSLVFCSEPPNWVKSKRTKNGKEEEVYKIPNRITIIYFPNIFLQNTNY